MPQKKSVKPAPSTISGRVIPGYGRGGQLGFSTANLDPKLAGNLPQGLFNCEVNISEQRYEGLLYHGWNSLSEKICLEVHLKNFNGDLLGQKIEVAVGRFLRPPKKFKKSEDLKAQIQQDVSVFFN